MARSAICLEEVILNDVPQTASHFVKSPAALDAEIFRQGDLDVRYIIAIPDRFQE